MNRQAFRNLRDDLENELNKTNLFTWSDEKYEKYNIDGVICEQEGHFHGSWLFFIVDNSIYGYNKDLKSLSHMTSKQTIRIGDGDSPHIGYGDYKVMNLCMYEDDIPITRWYSGNWVNEAIGSECCASVMYNDGSRENDVYFIVKPKTYKKMRVGYTIFKNDDYIKFLKQILT